MEVFFNELSCQPQATSNAAAKLKILELLEALKLLNKDGFNAMRTSDNFYSLELAPGYSFSNFFSDPTVSRDLRLLLKGVVKNPYIEDDSNYEAEIFVHSEFKTQDEKGVDVSPEGLASAYVFNSPVVSLTGHPHWQRDFIPLTIIANDDKQNPITAEIPNVYSVSSATGKPFKDWIQSLIAGIQLNSKENIALVFPPDKFEFDTTAVNDILFWHYDDKRFIIRIKELINDIVNNPFKGGKGHTEKLKGTGKASKRIIKKDRVVYTYTKEKITIHQCRFHYGDK